MKPLKHSLKGVFPLALFFILINSPSYAGQAAESSAMDATALSPADLAKSVGDFFRSDDLDVASLNAVLPAVGRMNPDDPATEPLKREIQSAASALTAEETIAAKNEYDQQRKLLIRTMKLRILDRRLQGFLDAKSGQDYAVRGKYVKYSSLLDDKHKWMMDQMAAELVDGARSTVDATNVAGGGKQKKIALKLSGGSKLAATSEEIQKILEGVPTGNGEGLYTKNISVVFPRINSLVQKYDAKSDDFILFANGVEIGEFYPFEDKTHESEMNRAIRDALKRNDKLLSLRILANRSTFQNSGRLRTKLLIQRIDVLPGDALPSTVVEDVPPPIVSRKAAAADEPSTSAQIQAILEQELADARAAAAGYAGVSGPTTLIIPGVNNLSFDDTATTNIITKRSGFLWLNKSTKKERHYDEDALPVLYANGVKIATITPEAIASIRSAQKAIQASAKPLKIRIDTQKGASGSSAEIYRISKVSIVP